MEGKDVMTESNRQWMLTRRPEGRDLSSACELVDGTITKLNDGDILIRNAWLSLDAGTRMWMGPREDSYSPPTPLGSAVIGMVVGPVVESRHPDYRAGDLVRAYGQWSDYSISRPDDVYVERVTWTLDDLRQHLAVFGPNGWTAYLGITEYCATKPGDTVVISAASGVTGALAGQVAKQMGCRVIGITGSEEKCNWITGELGFDRAIDHTRGNVASELKALCPDGVDVYYENVGGQLLDVVLGNMALFGRVGICGLIINYENDEPLPGPSHFDQILMKRLTFIGFFSPDFYHRGRDVDRVMRPWYEEGKLKMVFDETEGLENTLVAYQKLFTGAKIGKSLVTLADPHA
jgi:NADPH-dependent curcumin reductase CurA